MVKRAPTEKPPERRLPPRMAAPQSSFAATKRSCCSTLISRKLPMLGHVQGELALQKILAAYKEIIAM